MSNSELKKDNEFEPPADIKVQPEFRPEGSAVHLVSDGESWVSLAKRYRLTPEFLVDSNFRTKEPVYVNWYLHHYVKCDTPTPDRYNWTFSTSSRNGGGLRAGKIYIVPNWAEIVAQAKIQTRYFVETFFRTVSLAPCPIEDDRVTVPPRALGSHLQRADSFILPMRFAGAPDALAELWGEVLLRALRLFVEGLEGVGIGVFPSFPGLPPGFAPPPMRCKKWKILGLSSAMEGVMEAPFYEQIVRLAGFTGPEALRAIRDYGRWLEKSFRDMRSRAFTTDVMGSGKTDLYYRVFRGVAVGHNGFLAETTML